MTRSRTPTVCRRCDGLGTVHVRVTPLRGITARRRCRHCGGRGAS